MQYRFKCWSKTCCVLYLEPYEVSTDSCRAQKASVACSKLWHSCYEWNEIAANFKTCVFWLLWLHYRAPQNFSSLKQWSHLFLLTSVQLGHGFAGIACLCSPWCQMGWLEDQVNSDSAGTSGINWGLTYS